MRGSFSTQMGRSASRHHAYSAPDTSRAQEPSVYHGKMRTAPENSTPPVDIVLGVSAETIHAITVHQHKMMFQSPIGVMKEIVWDHSEKSVHFVLDDGSTSPTFTFPVLTELEAHFTAILSLPDLEKPPEQVYLGVLIGQNLPSPIQQRRASLGSSQPAMLPMSKRRELLRREQPVRNATSRERLGVEYMRSGYLCFTCSISGDLRGLTLGIRHLRVFPSPDCHDRSACLFSYSYEHLESCEVAGTRLELRFRTTHQLAKQPGYLVFQSLEAQYIREAIWFLKNGTYMDASLREMLASPPRPPRASNGEASQRISDVPVSPRASILMFFTDADSLKQRIDSCCRVIGCQHLVECSDQSGSKRDEASTSNMMIHINSGEPSHTNPSLRTNASTSRILTNGLCEFHTACLSATPSEPLSRQRSILSRDKFSLPAKAMQPLIALLQSTHYMKMFKFQGQLLKRQNARTFHLRKAWHQKFAVLFETPVGGFLCYYDKIIHCPGMTDLPKERRVIDLSSVLCIRPVSTASPVSRSNNASTPIMHAFDVVTLYRTWTFAAIEPEEYEVWLHVLTDCVEKHATIAPDRTLRFPVKLAMTGQSSPSEATSLEISSHGVSFCTGHEAEVVLSTWYYTDLEKWSVVFQQGYTCCLLKCRSPVPASPGSPRAVAGDSVTQDYLFRTADASTICLVIEFYVGKCMAKLEILAGQYLEESRAQKSKTELVADPVTSKRGAANMKLGLQLVKEHPIENVSLAPIGSPERAVTSKTDLPVTTSAVPGQDKALALTPFKHDEATPTLGATADVQSPITTEKAIIHDEPLIELEEPTQEAVAPYPLAGVAEKKCSSFKDDFAMIVDLPTEAFAPPQLTPCINGELEVQHENVSNPQEVVTEVEPLENPTSHDDLGDFESIDLEEDNAELKGSFQDESEADHDETATPSSPALPDTPRVWSNEEIRIVPSCSAPKCDESESSKQDDQVTTANLDADTPEQDGDGVLPLSPDVFMIEFRADVSCSGGVSSSTEHDGSKIASLNSLPELGDSPTAVRVPTLPSPPPLLLIKYIPLWTEEQQSVDFNEVEHPTPPGDDRDDRDDRQSECEVSDQSDAFNSCTSEVELLLEDASCHSQVSPLPTEEQGPVSLAEYSDEMFEDAIDNDLLPPTLEVRH